MVPCPNHAIFFSSIVNYLLKCLLKKKKPYLNNLTEVVGMILYKIHLQVYRKIILYIYLRISIQIYQYKNYDGYDPKERKGEVFF